MSADPRADLAAAASALWAARDLVEARLRDLAVADDRRVAAFDLAAQIPAVRALGALINEPETTRAKLLERLRESEAHGAWLADVVQRLRRDAAALGALRQVLPASFARARTAAEGRHRAWLTARPDEHIWGSEDAPVTLRQLWVPPAFALRTLVARRPQVAYGARDLRRRFPRPSGADAAEKTLSLLAGGATFIVLLGAAGSGKSSLLTMLASTLAANEDAVPVLVRLRDVDPNRALGQEIERLVDEAVGTATAADLVLLLDGFDEVPGERIGVAGSAVLHARELLRQGRVRAVVVAGRDVMLDEDDESFPPGAQVLRLLPFSREQVAAWCARWAVATGHAFDGASLLSPRDGGSASLDDVARVPLMLYLLATMARHGIVPDAGRGDVHTAAVYQRIVRWTCDRHEHRHGGRGLKSARLHGLLRVAGFVAMVRGGAIVDVADLHRAVRAMSPAQAEDLVRVEAEQTLLAFSFTHGDGRRWEFSHRTLAEFLAAEFLASACRSLVEDFVDEFGERRFRLDDAQATRLWWERFSPAVIPKRVERFLLPLLQEGDAEALPKLRRVLERVYRALLDEAEVEEGVRVGRSWALPAWQTRGVAFANLFALAGADASLLTAWGDGHTDDRFTPERAAPGRVREALDAILALNPLRYDDLPRWFGRVSLQGMPVGSLRSASEDHFVHWHARNLSRLSFAGCDLRGAVFVGCTMASVDLRGADLRGAKLLNCLLLHADLRGARLDGVVLVACVLDGARFDATVEGTPSVSGCLRRADTDPPLKGVRLTRLTEYKIVQGRAARRRA